jgi:rhomboid protease GluP
VSTPIDPLYWECVRRDFDDAFLRDLRLVLTAVGIDYRISHEQGVWCLWVPRGLGTVAAAEIERYAAENVAAQRPVALATAAVDSGRAGVLAFLFAIWLLPPLEALAPFGLDLRALGTLDATAVRAGAWWRTVTALTLHADIGHLIGNSVFGAVFGVLLARRLGSGVGWLAVLVCAALGNGLNAALQPDGFRSIGASTATFAALGIVAAFATRAGDLRDRGWRGVFAPAAAGIGLLAFTGVAGENTDLVAHLNGFGLGALCGWLLAGYRGQFADGRMQRTAGLITAGSLAVAWLLAVV